MIALLAFRNISEMDECPVGSPGVVTQFNTRCVKKFSRTFTYEELVSEGDLNLSLRDLASTTDTIGGGTEGCEIDLTTRISNF